VIFSNPRFILFLAGVLVVLAPPLPRAVKKRLLCLASLLFYAAWDYRYVALLVLVAAVDFVVALRIAGTGAPRTRRRWLVVSLVSNLGLLGYFKYANFFLDNLNGLLAPLGRELPHLDILLPAGISFFTFKTLSYTIDVYRGALAPCVDLVDYAMFVTFFPELIAGPIVRASVFLPQLDRPIGPTRARLVAGASLFLVGLTKKRLIADTAAVAADATFADPAAFSGPTLWLGVLAYTVQIYCDFSGYSDMAIGCSRMLGYDLPENFRMPYLSRDITEFWRRWHMTLSSWLRDYLYIPLGGNRRGAARTHLNLALTMLLGGLWHGASWGFVLWGALHGLALTVHRLWRRWMPALPGPLGWALTLAFVAIAWVPFRAPSLGAAATMLALMFGLAHGGTSWVPVLTLGATALLALGHAAGVALEARPGATSRVLVWLGYRVETNPISGPQLVLGAGTTAGVFVVAYWLLILYFLARTDSGAFIYFQF
jgi:alginate O-acetyltransferase complex protein AlgI